MLGLLIVIVPSRVSTEGEDGGWTMNAGADVSTRNPPPERGGGGAVQKNRFKEDQRLKTHSMPTQQDESIVEIPT